MLTTVVDELEERHELVGGPDPIRSAPIPLVFGGMCGSGGVAAQEAAADGVVERSADDDMDVKDGLGGEPLTGKSVAMVQQVAVELFETLGA